MSASARSRVSSTYAANIASVKEQLRRLLDFETTKNPARLLDNADWTRDVTLLDEREWRRSRKARKRLRAPWR